MPAATRIGDADVPHCSGMTRAQGSPNVFVNSIAWSRQGDVNTPHLLAGDPCPGHTAPIALGSLTCFINGRGAGRIGDAITACTSVAAGSPNAFVGSGAANGTGTTEHVKANVVLDKPAGGQVGGE